MAALSRRLSRASSARDEFQVTFEDVAAKAGLTDPTIYGGVAHNTYILETTGCGAAFIDYDNDGWLDVFLVNGTRLDAVDSQQHSNRLLHNNRDGTFTDVTRQAGLAIEMYGLGCTVGDFDNDGYDDIYITTVGSNHLFRNLGNGKFADVTTKAGVADPGFSAGAVWIDYDNDGKLDLFVAHYVEWSIATDQYC